MARMLPNRIAPEVTSSAERRVFDWLKRDPVTEEWIVLHSLGLARHERLLFGEIDFVVLAPDLGIFCLEVKGGRVAREGGFWCFTNRYGETNKKARGPFDQARDGMFSLMREVKTKLGNQEGYGSLLFGYGVVFPDIDFDIEGPDYDLGQVWDRSSCRDSPISSFIINLSRYTQKNQTRVYGEAKTRRLPKRTQIRAMAEYLRGNFDRPMLLSAQIHEADTCLMQLTKEQFRCLDMFEDNKRVVFEGSAGTGKTILAVELVRRSLERGERVAFICFNALLASWLKKQLHDCITEGSYVGTLHSFMFSHRIDTIVEPDSAYFSNRLPRELIEEDALRGVAFDLLVVDEAQDVITDEYLPILDEVLVNGLERGRWDFFGDFERQAIYQSGRTEASFLKTLDTYASFARARLSINCRNTKNIGEQVKLIAGFTAQFGERTPNGPRVTFLTWRDSAEESAKLNEIITKLVKNGIDLGDIALLTTRAPGYSDICFEDVHYPISAAENEMGIRFSSISAFKGLESPVVIIIDCTSYADLNLYYVGITRARTKLYVLENETAQAQRTALIREHIDGN